MKKTTSRILLSALAVLALLSLSGCAQEKEENTKQNDPQAREAILQCCEAIFGSAEETGTYHIRVTDERDGGRVLDHCPATAEVLPEIADAVGGKMTIFVDGAVRSGMDIFKALALGADAVLIGRPFVTAVYGGGEEGVQCYVQKLKAELADTMRMCGAHSLAEIDRSMIYHG